MRTRSRPPSCVLIWFSWCCPEFRSENGCRKLTYCTIKWKQKHKIYIFKHLEGKKKYFDLVPYVLYLLHFLITSSSSSSSSSYVAWWCRPARTPLPPSSITACFVVLSASFCQSSCHGWTVKRWSNSAWIESTCHRHTEPWLLWASCLPACILVSKALTWLLTLIKNVLLASWLNHWYAQLGLVLVLLHSQATPNLL